MKHRRNPAAAALRFYRHKVVRSAKRYSRKFKHRKED